MSPALCSTTVMGPFRTVPSLLLNVSLLFVVGCAVMTSDASQVLASPNETKPPVVRIGTVLADPPPSAVFVSVRITADGTVMRIPFQAPYVPVPDDQVNVLLIPGSGNTFSGIVLGGRSGQSGNRVLNGDMEAVRPGPAVLPPWHWTAYRVSGSTNVSVVGGIFAGHERPVMGIALTDNAASDNYVLSALIPVSPGEQWWLQSVGESKVATPSVTVELRAVWFKDDQGTYPSAASSETLADSFTLVGVDDFVLGFENITVPSNAKFMRVAVRVVGPGGVGAAYQVRVFNVGAYRN